MTVLTPEQRDRARGALLGSAVGDALGVPYEFEPALSSTTEPVMKGGGLGDFEPGEWSDDTAMMMSVARAGAHHGTLLTQTALDEVADGFLEWFASDPPDVGNQTRRVLSDSLRHRSATESIGQTMLRMSTALRQSGTRTGGNGALMRTAPVALAHLNDRDTLAQAASAVAALTHSDDDAEDACVLWCEAVRIAIVESRTDVYTGVDLLPAERRDVWMRRLDEARENDPKTFTPNGYTVTALQAAASSILHATGDGADHFRGGLFTAIRIGDDTDTVAAITGTLLGARWGQAAIPTTWQADVHGWPVTDGRPSTTDDLVRFADALTRGQGR
ncbi:ADP-ribosylglycohydrolase family protein [Gordonia sp. (in: high G+C Gram-positive bacteria)]|uniref:ADP-ribosylglycohydrolase family protein n=1 Tax=Gordonia sp. (in: high G+C Gram-positive bacteria) TaxID=84139 RepID=UPI003F9AEE5E